MLSRQGESSTALLNLKSHLFYGRKYSLHFSAGRVQSVAVRLIVEREKEIIGFKAESSFRITALFRTTHEKTEANLIKAEATGKYSDEKQVLQFLELCKEAEFTIRNVSVKPECPIPRQRLSQHQHFNRKLTVNLGFQCPRLWP